MALSRANFAAVKIGQAILVSGGNNKDLGVTSSCEYLLSDKWVPYPDMAVRR